MEEKEYPSEESGLRGIITAGESSDDKTQPPKSPLNSESNEDKKKPKQKRSPIIIEDHITVISGDPIRYKCKICTKEFKTRYHIKYHKFCRDSEKPFKCEECDKGFITKSHYQVHLRSHTGERPYVCQECGVGFIQSGKLNRHLKTHTGEKSCEKTFAEASNLNADLDGHSKNTHHDQPKEVEEQLADEAAAKYLTSGEKNKTRQDPEETDDQGQSGEKSYEDQQEFTAKLIPNEGLENVATSYPDDFETTPQIVSVYSIASIETATPHSNGPTKSLDSAPSESPSLAQPVRSLTKVCSSRDVIKRPASTSSKIRPSAFVMSEMNAGISAVMEESHRLELEHNYASPSVVPANSDRHTPTSPLAPFQDANKSSAKSQENDMAETPAPDQNNIDQCKASSFSSGRPSARVISKRGIGPEIGNRTRQPHAFKIATSSQAPATSTCQSSSESPMEIMEIDTIPHTSRSSEVRKFETQNLPRPAVRFGSYNGDASVDLKKLLHRKINRKYQPPSASATSSTASFSDLPIKASMGPAVAAAVVSTATEPGKLHRQSAKNSVSNVAGSSTSTSVSTEATDDNSPSDVLAAEFTSKLKVDTASAELESLRLIISLQELAKIRCSNETHMTCTAFIDFTIPEVNPMAFGNGYAFYSSTCNGLPCVLFLQEDGDQKISHSCIEIIGQFTDLVPGKYCSWSTGGDEEKVHVSVLPYCVVSSVANYVEFSGSSLAQKYFAILSSLTYWGHQHMSDLLVFSDVEDHHLVHVVPAYTAPSDLRRKLHTSNSFNDFQISLKQLFLHSQILSVAEQQVFVKFLSGSTEQVKAQLIRFLQIKLFSSKLGPEVLAEFKVVTQSESEKCFIAWLEKERELCINEFHKQLLKGHSRPISPLKRAHIEFLAVPDSSVKQLLDLMLEMC